jgi:molecular chaperone HtpG
VEIFIDPSGQTVGLLAGLYDREYSAFGHMTKDFVRTVIFPHVADLVPSASRQGAEAFLKAIERNREVFEIESADVDNLKALLMDLFEGKITVQEAAQRSGVAAARTHQVLDSTETAPVREIVPDVIDNQIALPQSPFSNLSAIPPIQRLDIETQRKILTIGDDEPALKGYRCFLALTERVCEEKGDFFRQPHKTSVVWGGQRALFVFEHHSGEFGLYYDIQTREPVGDGSGGGPFETCTIVMKNRIFIPIPPPIQTSFIPATGEKKRLDVHGDILYIDRS